ncbi:SLC13 family permease, partial [Sphingomonas sp.]|uniref:SLC13 family permease n=1 Tax=Sphingomonas sp. TaxID=28214 RepID=UPI0035AEEAF3
ALLSMVTKNVGALAILMPVALRMGRGRHSSPAALLMPMSFLSLLGGLVTLVGTSTNIIVSQVREEMLGKPFAMFDFTPVGLALTALGLIFVSFGWRLLPRDRQGRADLGEIASRATYSTEARIADELPAGTATIADLKLGEDKVQARAMILPDGGRLRTLADMQLVPGASLILEGEDAALDRVFARTPLAPERAGSDIERDRSEEMRTLEAVVQLDSALIGQTAERTRMEDRYGVQLLGVRRNGERIVDRLRDIRLRGGDLLILRAGESAFPEMMGQLGLLPLAERNVKMGERRGRWLPVVILLAAMILVGTGRMPVAAAFFGAAVMMVVIGALPIREAYRSLEPEVLILIGALTPLSEAVRESGGTDLIAHALVGQLHVLPAIWALGAMMLVAMACSPFLHNAPTVLVLGPIAVEVATGLGLHPDAFLMAVAVGSGCDFLTPIGHQCNTLVMSPGGYLFGDYWRLGLPLSVLVLVAGTPLIAAVWPM